MMSLCYQDPKNRFFLWTILVLVSLICAAYFLGNGLSQNEYKQVCTTTYYFILFSCLSVYTILYYFHRRDSQDGDSFIQHRLQSQMHARFIFFLYYIYHFHILIASNSLPLFNFPRHHAVILLELIPCLKEFLLQHLTWKQGPYGPLLLLTTYANF